MTYRTHKRILIEDNNVSLSNDDQVSSTTCIPIYNEQIDFLEWESHPAGR